jgi:hypothetical protein
MLALPQCSNDIISNPAPPDMVDLMSLINTSVSGSS